MIIMTRVMVQCSALVGIGVGTTEPGLHTVAGFEPLCVQMMFEVVVLVVSITGLVEGDEEPLETDKLKLILVEDTVD